MEREARRLSVVWACTRLQQFLLGKSSILQIEHKPLVHIFDPKRAIKVDSSPRLMNFAVKIMRFDFEIRHVKGVSNTVADALSRVLYDDEDTEVPQINFSRPGMDASMLSHEAFSDRFL